MIPALILLPLFGGVAAFLLRSDSLRRALVVGSVVAHAFLVASCLWRRPPPVWAASLALDAAGLLFLTITSVLFVAVTVYGVGYLARVSSHPAKKTGGRFSPEAVFSGCLLLFLATVTLVTTAQHFGVLWVAVEATTLATAPLICFHRNPRSLEATWKYLLICSVGIALALLGNFFLAVAAGFGGEDVPLVLQDMLASAGNLNPTWLKLAFAFLLIGYGTKMGLAPLHTWLPDAHSEAPSMVSALLSGALLNCAFLALLRVDAICVAAGQGAFAAGLFMVFGLLSVGLAAVFLLGQRDYKRLLAYSSVEHMGLLAFGVGAGGRGIYGALLHAVNHSLVKSALFLLAGNLLARFGSKAVAEVRGARRLLPVTGTLWVLGFLAITGSPPFGVFLSKLVMLKGAVDEGHVFAAAALLVMLVIIFLGMGPVFLRMAGGKPLEERSTAAREPLLSILPPLGLGALALLLGCYLPAPLYDLIDAIARSLEAP